MILLFEQNSFNYFSFDLSYKINLISLFNTNFLQYLDFLSRTYFEYPKKFIKIQVIFSSFVISYFLFLNKNL